MSPSGGGRAPKCADGAKGCAVDEVGADLTRRLDDARQHLIDAYEWARRTGYTPGSPDMDNLAAAEDRYQHTRRRWQDHQDRHRGTAGGQGGQGGSPAQDQSGQPPERLLDLDQQPAQIDLEAGTRQPTNGC